MWFSYGALTFSQWSGIKRHFPASLRGVPERS